MEMELTYAGLSRGELQGATKADYLVALDAVLRVIDEGDIVFEEPGFPVVELARHLTRWLGDPSGDDFVFESMSYEDAGALMVTQRPEGWTLSSVLGGSPSQPACWAEMDRCLRTFLLEVNHDLARLEVDADWLMRQ